MLRRETEYLHEAQMMEGMARNFAAEHDILFPEVVHELTTPDVLTMTFMEGIKITRFDEIERAGIDRTAVATRLIQSFYKQLFVDRLFHADPHPGNFLVLPGPKIVVLDFGAVSVAHTEILDGLLDMVQAVFTQNERDVIKGFKRMGFVAKDANTELIERTVLTYFKKLLKVKDRTPGALMRAKRSELEELADPELERAELRELMRSIQYPPDWFYIERACVLMFWLCGQIDPELDTMQVGFPYVLPLLLERSAKYDAAG
jgi:ubiquinone biosynthesis protein